MTETPTAPTAEAPPSPDFGRIVRRLALGRMTVDEAPEPVVEAIAKMMGRSRADFVAWLDERHAREAHSPRPGAEAPDWELELVSAQGERNGEMRRLSDHRGRPVALIFGSYT